MSEQAIAKRSQSVLWIESILTDERSGVVKSVCEGTGVSLSKLNASLMEAALSNPAIMQANPASVFRSVLQAARLGIAPTGMRNGAYYSVYGSDCKLGLGYGALNELAVRFGKVTRFTLGKVHPNDLFTFRQGDDAKLVHEPAFQDLGGEPYAYYAVAWFADGSREAEVMRREEVESIRRRARNQNGPWKTDFDEMAKKTVLIRLHKRLVIDSVVGEAIDVANDEDFDFRRDDGGASDSRAERMSRNARQVVNTADTPSEPVDIPPAIPDAVPESGHVRPAQRVTNRPSGQMTITDADIDAALGDGRGDHY